MLSKVGSSVKKVELMVLERSQALRVTFCRLFPHVADRCIVVLVTTHESGPSMLRRRGWAPMVDYWNCKVQDPQARARFFFNVAVSCTRGNLERFVQEELAALNGDDIAVFYVSLV